MGAETQKRRVLSTVWTCHYRHLPFASLHHQLKKKKNIKENGRNEIDIPRRIQAEPERVDDASAGRRGPREGRNTREGRHRDEGEGLHHLRGREGRLQPRENRGRGRGGGEEGRWRGEEIQEVQEGEEREERKDRNRPPSHPELRPDLHRRTQRPRPR